MRAYERFLRYAAVDTPSDESSETTPSSACQLDLARLLAEELKNLGLSDASVDEKGYVYASLPATPGCEQAERLALIAHMDTAPDFNGRGVRPRVIPNYSGEDVPLGESGRTLRVSDFPHLRALEGQTLIVTDGQTLLGADDKAGIAEIMTLLEELTAGGQPHGKLSVCFTPDEEIGRGADYVDVQRVDADFAYTLDGSDEGGIEYENFNAAAVEVTVCGFNIHPGDAKNKMINASLVAMEFNARLPAEETPRDTEGYEGFFHLLRMTGDVETAHLSYIIRDHDIARFDERKAAIRAIAAALNKRYGEGTVTCTLRDQYHNMAEIIDSCPHLIEFARLATEQAGLKPRISPIRGGTDGARLSFMGLPCPNLGTGGHAFHGPYEHITAEAMDSVVRILRELVGLFSRRVRN